MDLPSPSSSQRCGNDVLPGVLMRACSEGRCQPWAHSPFTGVCVYVSQAFVKCLWEETPFSVAR